MILFSIFLTFFALAAANVDNCSLGEPFWCENVVNANACGAFEHCLSSVWVTMAIEDTECEDGVEVIQKILKQSAVDKDVELCDLLNGNHKKACDHVVRHHPEEIETLTQSNLKLNAVAKLLGLCGEIEVKGESKLCSDCKAFLSDIEDLVIGPNIESEALDQMRAMCRQLPDQISQYCESVAVDWVENLFAFLKHQMKAYVNNSLNGDPSSLTITFTTLILRNPVGLVCETLTFCSYKTEAVNFDFRELIDMYHKEYDNTSMAGDSVCNTCQAVLGDVKGLFDDPEFKTELNDLLKETFCAFLPGRMKTACEKNMGEISDLFLDILTAEMDPLIMCEAFGMCKDKTQLAIASADKISSIMDVLEPAVMSAAKKAEPVARVLNPFLKKIVSSDVLSSQCSVCEVVVKEVRTILKGQESKNKVVSSLEKVCMYLPEPLADECKGFVSVHGAELIDMVISSITPKMVCQAIGMCDDDKKDVKQVPALAALLKASIMKPVVQAPPQKTQVHQVRAGMTPWCEICEEMATVASQFINSKELEEISVGLGEGICYMLPSSAKPRCKVMLKSVVDTILGDMTQIVVPSFVCGVVGVCELHLTPMHYKTKPFFDMSKVVPQEVQE